MNTVDIFIMSTEHKGHLKSFRSYWDPCRVALFGGPDRNLKRSQVSVTCSITEIHAVVNAHVNECMLMLHKLLTEQCSKCIAQEHLPRILSIYLSAVFSFNLSQLTYILLSDGWHLCIT